MPSLRERRGRFAYALPALAESQGESCFDISTWTPLCQRTPQGDVDLIAKKPAAKRVLPMAELQHALDPWEKSECLSVTEQDLQRCGGDVSLLRQCAARRKMQESCTPWPTPMAKTGQPHGLGQKAGILPVDMPPESFAGAEEFRSKLALGLRGLQKTAPGQKQKVWQSSYRLPGIYTVLRELDDDLPPKLPPKKLSSGAWPIMKSPSSSSLALSGPALRSAKSLGERSGVAQSGSLPTL